MKTIAERAKECFPDPWDADCILPVREGFIVGQQRQGYISGANEQKALDIDKACNIYCHVRCPHTTDPYDCLNNKCDAWKRFRRMMEEEL